MSKDELIKNNFASIAHFYGDSYYGDSPKGHLFSTRLKRVMELLEGVNGESVLDVGCGPGIVASYLLEEHYDRYFGIDFVEEMLLDCRDRYQNTEKVYLGVGDLNKLPFPNSSFEVILCLGALEYVEDANVSIREFSRVVKERGTIVISMQNKNSPYRIWDRHIYRSKAFGSVKSLLGREPAGELLERPINLSKSKNLLAKNGFEVLDVIYYDFNLWFTPIDSNFPKLSVRTSSKMEFLCRSPLRSLGTGYIVKATKLSS